MSKVRFDKRILLPIIHFLLSFIWEWLVLVPKDWVAVALSKPLSNAFSYSFEQGMCYVISKIMAGIIIFLLWKIVFNVFDKKIDKETVIVFGTILTIGVVTTLILWPDVFEAGGDNYIPYSYAIRLVPEYWHSIYLSCLYSASLMVLPHAVSINLLQMVAFVCAVGYLYNRIKNSNTLGNARYARFIILLMFVLRDSFTVATNPERAEYNASFTLLFVSIVLMDIVEKKVRKKHELAALLVFTAFLAVFRSEGIVIALLSFVVLIAFVYKPGWIRATAIFALLLIAFFFFKFPIKVGDIKYYGSDYSIVNSFNPLHNIFCAKSANFSYDGSDADMAAIEAITPIELIKEFGSEGYRRFNYASGRLDINQSAAGAEASAAYKKAYVNIVRHNLGIYVKTQLSMFMQAAGISGAEYVEPYNGTGTEIEPFGQELWEVGRLDYQSIPGKYNWTHSGIRNKVAAAITIPRLKYVDLLTKSRLYTLGLLFEIIFGAFIVLDTIVKLIKKKRPQLAAGVLALILSGFVLLLAFVMPVGANMYFHAYIYSMFAVIVVYITGLLSARETPTKKELATAVLVLAGIACAAGVSIKMIISGYTIDDAYHVAMSYRRACGDRLFMEMWEPHQTSAFLSAALIKLFVTVTGSTTYVVVFLRVCGLVFHGIVATILYRSIESLTGKKSAFIIGLIYYASFPKLTAIPEFSNMQLWFITLSLCLLFKAYESHFSKGIYTVASAIFLCLAIITFPSGVIVACAYIIALAMSTEARQRSLWYFIITCLACAGLYSILIFAGKDIETVIANMGNMISGDASHMGGTNALGESGILSLLKWILMIVLSSGVVIGISCVVVLVIRRLKSEISFSETIFAVSATICFALTAFFCFFKQTGFDCVKLQFVVLPAEAVFFLIKERKNSEDKNGRNHFLVAAIASGVLVLAGVTIVTNLELKNNLPYLIVAMIWSIVAAFYLFGEKPVLTWAMAFACVVSLGVTGYTQKTTGIGQNIFQYNAKVSDGPAKGVICDWVVKAAYEGTNPEVRAIVQEGDSLFVFSDSLYVAATELYMVEPVKIAQYSTICTPTFGEKHVEYWKQFPDRLPTIVGIENSQSDRVKDFYAYKWLMDNYTFEIVEEGEIYTFYRRTN